MTESADGPTWRYLPLGDAMLAQPALAEIRDALAAACEVGDPPSGMAVFARHVSDGALHCQVHVYFAPGAAALAQQFGARPCEQPASQGLELLGGNAGALERGD